MPFVVYELYSRRLICQPKTATPTGCGVITSGTGQHLFRSSSAGEATPSRGSHMNQVRTNRWTPKHSHHVDIQIGISDGTFTCNMQFIGEVAYVLLKNTGNYEAQIKVITIFQTTKTTVFIVQ